MERWAHLTDLNNMAFIIMIKLSRRIVKCLTISDINGLKFILKLADSDLQMFFDKVAMVRNVKNNYT